MKQLFRKQETSWNVMFCERKGNKYDKFYDCWSLQLWESLYTLENVEN
jgi:hypothetical protein